jgi:hypothetical protein
MTTVIPNLRHTTPKPSAAGQYPVARNYRGELVLVSCGTLQASVAGVLVSCGTPQVSVAGVLLPCGTPQASIAGVLVSRGTPQASVAGVLPPCGTPQAMATAFNQSNHFITF